MNDWMGRIAFVAIIATSVWMLGNAASLSQAPRGYGLEGISESAAANDSLQIVSTMLPSGTQQIVVVEPAARTLAVYHVEPAQGKIQLKSVRNLVWDLRMENFNGQSPLPSELRQVEP